MKVPYGKVAWKDMQSPFRGLKMESQDPKIRELELVAVGYELVISYGSLAEKDRIVLDCGWTIDGAGSLVVVLGEEKDAWPCSQKIYVILVSPWDGNSMGHIYRRIGAGTLVGRENIKIGSGKKIRVR